MHPRVGSPKTSSFASMNQQHQHPPPSPPPPPPPDTSPREQSEHEASSVLSSTGWHEGNLESFNLLSVVTNPRSSVGHHTFPSLSPPSTSLHSETSTSSSWNTDAFTIENLTATVNDLTNFLEDISHSFFDQEPNQDEYSPDSELPFSQLEKLPSKYEVGFETLEVWYKQGGGMLSEAFEDRGLDEEGLEEWKLEEEGSKTKQIMGLSDIPEIFFDPYFDLTDPETFRLLLQLCEGGNEDVGRRNGSTNQTNSTDNNNNDEMASSLPSRPLNNQFQPPNYEALTCHLDTIEISLLHQVKTKSSHFFRETDNFQTLKSLIATCIHDVQTLRHTLKQVKQRSVNEVQSIPLLASKRDCLNDLKDILEQTERILQAKAGVGSWVASNQGDEYFTALEAIHSSRDLLQKHNLTKLECLNKVQDQLSDYETLITTNWTDDLIQLFLNWEQRQQENDSFLSKERNKIRGILHGLNKCKYLPEMNDVYETRLTELIKMTVKTTVSECATDALKNGGTDKPKLNRSNSITDGVTSMTFDQFLSCLDILFDQLLLILKNAVGVNTFLKEENITFETESLTNAAELVHKSLSELLRLRKEAHSLISLQEMKTLWDTCLAFVLQLEKMANLKAYGLRSTLLSQAKAFLERRHESNMAMLVASLDSEKWMQCDVSPERQAALTRLCSGRAVLSSNLKSLTYHPITSGTKPKQPLSSAEIEGIHYKTVWSCLLLVEMIMTNVSCAAHFQTLATSVVSKISELLRLFNSRTTQLVLGAGAIHSAARLKSINAKHLALVTQCLGVVLAILPHIRAALMAQLPSKQHSLLLDLDKIQKDYHEHSEKVLSKFVSIIGGIVEHGLAPKIQFIDFDERGKMGTNTDKLSLCAFLDGINSNTKKMHQVLSTLLPNEHLRDVFSRIFAYVDQKVPTLLEQASDKKNDNNHNHNSNSNTNGFTFPITEEGKQRMILEVHTLCRNLNSLEAVLEWDFTADKVLERKLGVQRGTIDEKQEIENDDTHDIDVQSDSDAKPGNNHDHPIRVEEESNSEVTTNEEHEETSTNEELSNTES